MAELQQQEASSPNPDAKKPAALCEECKSNDSKYKCPGCSIRSCSLPCVKAHKQRTGCTGKRQKTHFLPLSQFDDNVILSDYNMLEDVKRVADSAKRMRVKLCGNSHFGLAPHLKYLKRAATYHRIKLLFLSPGMSRREINKTFYHSRKKSISWTIEWRFYSTEVTLIDHGVHENSNISSVMENHLQPGPWSHQLKQFCLEPLESLKFFIRTYPKGPKSPFRELNIKAPIREQLANLVIIEYPVIHVFLPSTSYNFEVTVEPIPRKVESKESVDCNQPSQKGVFFREEEIEDDNCSDTKVLDLTKHGKPDGNFEAPRQNGPHERRLNNISGPHSPRLVESSGHFRKDEVINSKTIEPGVCDSMYFDFDVGLLDAYSDLISDNNPDHFLEFQGTFSEDVELEETKNLIDFSGVSPVEELEEGEIPGF